MRHLSPLLLAILSLMIIGNSCSNDKSSGNPTGDSTNDTITVGSANDTIKIRFKKLASAMPIPFEMLKKFSSAHLPFKGELLNVPENAVSYNSSGMQAMNLGIYGADLAYMISQNKLGESAPFLKSIRRLSDAIVVPTAFDLKIMKRYDNNLDQKDSMQSLMKTSYARIDSTLQGNDRLTLATLVLAGGWLEGIYLTTQHIGDEKQNEKNKVLFDMLAVQQPYVTDISELLGSFPNDSICKNLHTDFLELKKVFPNGPDVSPTEYAAELKALGEKVAEVRNRIIKIK